MPRAKAKKPAGPTKLEQVATGKLIPYAGNSRTHSETQVGQIAASIREFGFLAPILADAKNNVIAGHGRLLAAIKLELPTVPVVRADHLTKAQQRAYVIADNRLAELAEWDNELLRAEVEQLLDVDFDVSLVGLSDSDLDALLGRTGGGEGDGDIPPDTDLPADQYGVIVMCGDAGEQEEVYNRLESEGYSCRVVTV